MIEASFWQNKKVFVTGHTGFKGSWLCLWLHSLGAEVTGYALDPPTAPSMFELCRISQLINSVKGDVRELRSLNDAMHAAAPEVVIHMAAQPLVLDSYKMPVDTYATNVMGTVHLLDAVRTCPSVKAVVNVTTDKCYENREWVWGYREDERLGGYDPYSSSKACSELVTQSYVNSFFNTAKYQTHGVALASARAGNVIGGGDWAADRLVPDCIRAISNGKIINIRNPQAIRPWQHVLEPLSGYLLLAQKLYSGNGRYAEGWNFGPNDGDMKPVEWIVRRICSEWGGNAGYEVTVSAQKQHEAHCLKLDCSKAKLELDWYPRWNLETALDRSIEWYKAFIMNKDLRAATIEQIHLYENTSRGNM